jgi:hypothetical protein
MHSHGTQKTLPKFITEMSRRTAGKDTLTWVLTLDLNEMHPKIDALPNETHLHAEDFHRLSPMSTYGMWFHWSNSADARLCSALADTLYFCSCLSFLFAGEGSPLDSRVY